MKVECIPPMRNLVSFIPHCCGGDAYPIEFEQCEPDNSLRSQQNYEYVEVKMRLLPKISNTHCLEVLRSFQYCSGVVVSHFVNPGFESQSTTKENYYSFKQCIYPPGAGVANKSPSLSLSMEIVLPPNKNPVQCTSKI